MNLAANVVNNMNLNVYKNGVISLIHLKELFRQHVGFSPKRLVAFLMLLDYSSHHPLLGTVAGADGIMVQQHLET